MPSCLITFKRSSEEVEENVNLFFRVNLQDTLLLTTKTFTDGKICICKRRNGREMDHGAGEREFRLEAN